MYLVLAGVLRRRHELRMLTEAFIALGIVFLILAVPFAFDGHGTAAAWALEGAGLVWIGVRQQRLVARCVGGLLLIGAGVAFEAVTTPSVSTLPILNSRFLGSVAIAIGGLVASRQVRLGSRGTAGVGSADRMGAACMGTVVVGGCRMAGNRSVRAGRPSVIESFARSLPPARWQPR